MLDRTISGSQSLNRICQFMLLMGFRGFNQRHHGPLIWPQNAGNLINNNLKFLKFCGCPLQGSTFRGPYLKLIYDPASVAEPYDNNQRSTSKKNEPERQ